MVKCGSISIIVINLRYNIKKQKRLLFHQFHILKNIILKGLGIVKKLKINGKIIMSDIAYKHKKPIRISKYTRPIEYKSSRVSSYTKLSYTFVVLTSIIMLYLFLRYVFIEKSTWPYFALLLFLFNTFGFIFSNVINQEPILPDVFTPFNDPKEKGLINSTLLRAGIIVVLCFVIQQILQLVASFATYDQVLYYVFASVAEEVFFRAFITNFLIKINKNPIIFFVVWCPLQSAIFTSLHFSYYGDFTALAGIFFIGYMLGAVYYYWRDITANILGHFFLNFSVALLVYVFI